MTDFPAAAAPGTSILSSVDTAQHAHAYPVQGPNGGSVWPSANRAIYVPVLVEEIEVVTQMAIIPTVQSGNFDVGIYTETGVRLVSKGSTVVGAANVVQAVDITDTLLTPGVYFFALCIDNTTAAVYKASSSAAAWAQALCVQQQAVGAVTLPNPATFTNPTAALVPLIQAICMAAVI